MKSRIEMLKKKIDRYLTKEQLFKNDEHKKLEKPFLTKSRKNFTVANLLFRISEQEDMRKMLALASDFEVYDWVIIVSYYAMYASALAALAKLGFKSKSHAATITVLKCHCIPEEKNKNQGDTKTLDQKDIHKLVKAYTLSEQLITKLIQTKTKRETAQYDATPAITRENAKTALDDAEEFIIKIEEMLG